MGVYMRMCKVCLSVYRDEVVTLWKRGTGRRIIYDKYAPLMKYTGTFGSFTNLIYVHLKHHAQNVDLIIPTGRKNKIHTMDTIADRFTDLLGQKAEGMDPSSVSVKDYAAVQKVVSENKKLKLTETAMMINLSKIFGPPIVGEIQEGEEVNELGRGEDTTNKPSNP
jgi:hypothetical protein